MEFSLSGQVEKDFKRVAAMVSTACPIFALYVVWHPSFVGGREIAERIRVHFGRDLYRFVNQACDVSVLFRSDPVPGASTPMPVDWSEATVTAAVVLTESALVDDPEWGRYIRHMVRAKREAGEANRFFPVAVDSRGIEFGFKEQAIRWDRWDMSDTDRYTRLMSDLTHEFCRLLRHRLDESRLGNEPSFERLLEKIQVFISHSKHDGDGEVVARAVRDWIHEHSQLSSFFDVHDIPPGQSFRDVLRHRIAAGALLAVHTDSYSSREWCRREVIEAKRLMVPMIVLDCIRDSDPRGIPYLGNVPMVRMDPGLKNRIATVVGRLLDELFRTWLWRYRIEPYRAECPDALFTARPPELIALAALPRRREGRESVLVYPEPMLGTDEQRLFSEVVQDVRVRTLSEWLEERR